MKKINNIIILLTTPKVVFVDGVYGVGKSSVISEIESLGKNVVDERYIEYAKEGYYEMREDYYAHKYLMEHLSRIYTLIDRGAKLIYVDVSPYASFVYRKNRYMHFPIINQLHETLKAEVNVVMVLLDVDPIIGRQRVANRFVANNVVENDEENDVRLSLAEMDTEHYKMVYHSYLSLAGLGIYDLIINTTEKTVKEIAGIIIKDC